jgi:hypothetical protein
MPMTASSITRLPERTGAELDTYIASETEKHRRRGAAFLYAITRLQANSGAGLLVLDLIDEWDNADPKEAIVYPNDIYDFAQEPGPKLTEMYRQKWARRLLQYVAYELEDHDGEGVTVEDVKKQFAERSQPDIDSGMTWCRSQEEQAVLVELVSRLLVNKVP